MMYINGKWQDAANDATFPVQNPATGQEIGRVPDGTGADAAAAIDAADGAFPEWSRLTAYQRSAYLYEAHQLMESARRTSPS